MSDPQLDETKPLPHGRPDAPPDAAPSGAASSEPAPAGAAPPALADGAEAARPAAQPADLVGKQLGDFKILRRLGAGGMAEVFLAEQVSLRRQVALKVLKPELLDGSDDTHLRRFVQEATAAANLNHPHIVQVYAIGEQRGIHYIAQEYVPGLTLREWLRRNGPPEPLAAIRILRQVALALQAAAEAGIVHRDVKPENILLTKKGDAKVADFGLAQLSQTGERVQLTQTGITMGTPLYMSPEQVAGKPLDQRSDLYSLGVTAYHLLAGSPPFRGETALSVAVQHLNAPAEPLQDVRPDLPVALAELVQKMMEKRPERRYQSAADLAEDLRALGVALKTDPQGAVKKGLDSFTTAKPAEPPRRPLALDRFFEWPGRRHAAMLAAAAAVALLLSVAVGRATKPADPFRLPPPTDSDVLKADDARDQYNAALVAGTAEAYQAVREYWKDDPGASFWRALATLRLALLRLSERDFTGAAELFREMTASPDEWSRVNGAAGLAILAALQDQEPEFRRILSQLLLTDDVDELHSELRYLLEGIRERDRFNRETQLDLDRLLDEAGAEQPDGRDGRGGQAGSPGPSAS